MYELGLSYKQFQCMTMREYELRFQGFEREQKRQTNIIREVSDDQWRQARFIAYVSALPHMKDQKTIWEWYPLPGDPTKQDMIDAAEKKKKDDAEWQKKVIENFRAKKHIK